MFHKIFEIMLRPTMLIKRYMLMIIIALTLFVSSAICINDSNLMIGKLNTGLIETTRSSSWWNLSNIWNWFNGESNPSIGSARTFGHIRRMQMALIPIVFKFGVLSAMITVLVFLGLKTIILLKALLVINAGSILAKLLSIKSHHGPMFPGWSPYPDWSHHSPGWPPNWQHNLEGKEVHVHIHNAPKSDSYHHKHWDSEPYGAYSSNSNNYAKSSQGGGPGPERYGNVIYHNN